MIEITLSGSDELLVDLAQAPESTTRAMVRALNRAIASTRTFMARAVARDVGLKYGDVLAAFRLRQATASAPEASVGASLKRIPLIKFGARGPEPSRGRGRGVTYAIGQGSRGRQPQAFIATVGTSGHRGVFVRDQRGGGSVRKSRGAWSKNLPIRELYGPSLGHVFGKYRAQGLDVAREAFAKNFAHEQIFASGGTTNDASV
jgi:hypothetical protein